MLFVGPSWWCREGKASTRLREPSLRCPLSTAQARRRFSCRQRACCPRGMDSDFAVLLLADRHEADIHVACISQQHLCCLWEIRLQSIERSLANERQELRHGSTAGSGGSAVAFKPCERRSRQSPARGVAVIHSGAASGGAILGARHCTLLASAVKCALYGNGQASGEQSRTSLV